MARVLTAAYFKLKGLTAEQRQARFGANYRDVSRSGFKALILAEFNKELEEYKARPNFIPTRFNDIFVANVLTDLNKGNSQIFNYFLIILIRTMVLIASVLIKIIGLSMMKVQKKDNVMLLKILK